MKNRWMMTILGLLALSVSGVTVGFLLRKGAGAAEK